MHNQPLLSPADLLAALGQPRFILMMGLPASGKTTLSKQIAQFGYQRYSSDECRQHLYGDESIVGNHDEVFGLLHQLVSQSLQAGDKVVVDATNLAYAWRQACVLMATAQSIRLEIILLDVPYSVCLARDRKRTRQVGADGLSWMARKLQQEGIPLTSEGRLTVLRPSWQENCYTVSGPGDPLVVMHDIPR